MSTSRLGDPVELPWWFIPLALPPAVALVLALFLGAPSWSRILTIAVSLLTIGALALIATRVASRNMQSVWVSALYAVWFFTVVAWAVTVATYTTCHCA